MRSGPEANRRIATCLVLGWAFGLLGTARGDEPLHRRVDRLVEASLTVEPAAHSTDAEFLRRAFLDLHGMIPSAEEARAFLDDPSPYKRTRLIDRLLDDPAYAWRMAEIFDLTLMERRAETHVKTADWRAFLREAFAENRPYDQLAAEILAADGLERAPGRRAAARFFLDRQAEPNLLTRDVARIFLGRDVQCSQCHDHPLVDDYKQAHYYGLFAFVSRTTLFDQPGVGNVLAEKAEGDVTYSSVFKKGVTHKTGPRVLDGPAVPEPDVAKGAEYLLAPDKNNKVRPIPRVSRRKELAGAVAKANLPEFNKNVANRLWAILMGKGLVHPLDMHHADNPPSHPELLDLLAEEFAASGYDVKTFLRELALTRTYQRSSEPPPGPGPAENASAEFESSTEPPALSVATLKPLSPEQLAWSVMRGLGLVEPARREAERRLGGADPRLSAIFATDAKREALRRRMIEESVHEQLKSGVDPFVRQFAASAGQPQDGVEPTVHQALFLSNGEPIQSWLAPSGDRLVGRLEKLTDPSALAEELYLSLYTRRPTAEEREAVAAYLATRAAERPAALKELVWALLASTEFRFNH
ncbi:MAG: DUF1549 domain-containing protein [Isosphaeraceae bacterium]